MILPLLLAQVAGDDSVAVLSLGGKKYLFSAPAFVASGVAMARWSRDGSQLFALRGEMPSPFREPSKVQPKPKLLFYGVRQKKVLAEFELPEGRPELSWEGVSGSVIVSTEQLTPDGQSIPSLYRAKPGQRLESLWVPGANGYLAAMTSNTQPGVLMFIQPIAPAGEPPGVRSYYWLAPGSREGTLVDFQGANGPVGIGEDWTMPVYGSGVPVRFFRFDPRMGFVELKERPVPKTPIAEATTGEAVSKWEKKAVPLKSLWVYDTKIVGSGSNAMPPKDSFTLVATKANQGEFAEGSLSVFYIDEGNLFVRRLNPTSEAEIEMLRWRAEVRAVNERAWRIGQALLAYLREHRSQVPGDPGELRLSGRDVEGIEWVYKGPADAGLVAEPATTEVARVVSPRGVCTVMLSGKVVWVPSR